MKKKLIIPMSLCLVILLFCLYIFKVIIITPVFANSFSVKGVDVSHYQGTIDWQEIKKQNISFAFIKATEGSYYIDKKFDENKSGAQKAQIFCGFYHFFSFESSGEAQAKHFIETVGDIDGCLAPVVDVEFYGNNKPPKDKLLSELRVFLDIVENGYGIKPIIYSTCGFYNKYLSKSFTEYPLWIRNVYFYSFKNWTFWQYTDKGILEGYSGEEKYIDINVFKGSFEDLKKYIISEPVAL